MVSFCLEGDLGEIGIVDLGLTSWSQVGLFRLAGLGSSLEGLVLMTVLFKVGLETCLFRLVLGLVAIERLLGGMHGSNFLVVDAGFGSWELSVGLCLSDILT